MHGTPRRKPEELALSNHYAILIIGIPSISLLIASAAMLESKGFPIPLVRIGTGTAGLIIQAIPFVLFGSVGSALIRIWTHRPPTVTGLHRHPLLGIGAIICASTCLPCCDCATAPLFNSLTRRGTNSAYTVAFLCAAPTLNPIALWATYYAFPSKPWLVALRVLFSLAVALATAASFLIRPAEHTLRRASALPQCTTQYTTAPHTQARASIASIIAHTHGEFMRIMPITLLACLASSICNTILRSFSSQGTTTSLHINLAASIILAMAISACCSVCSSSDAVIAAALSPLLPLPAIMAFLTFGPICNGKNIALLLQQCASRYIARIIITVLAACLAGALLIAPISTLG